MGRRPPTLPGTEELLVSVAVAAGLDKPLTYAWTLPQDPEPGLRVEVPLRGRQAIGFVIDVQPEPPQGYACKPVLRALEDRPLFTPTLLKLLAWLAEYYRHPLGLTLSTALPLAGGKKAAGPQPLKAARAIETDPPPELPRVQEEVYGALAGRGWVPFKVLRQLVPGIDSAAKALLKKGLIEVDHFAPDDRLPDAGFQPGPPPEPTPEQARALEGITQALGKGGFNPFLLHGVTGSGKTEVYLRAGQAAVEAGRTAIILVPEIALTPRLEALFRHRFGDQVAVLHSGLSPSVRAGQWLNLLEGRAAIALGARSAIFAPLQNVGLIVVDEEHEPSYKQEDGLRYQARDVALVRGRMEGAAVVLGSATPSVVSQFNQVSGKYRPLAMEARVNDKPLPQVEIIDLKKEPQPDKGPLVLGKRLIEATKQTLAEGHQALFFLNRRGFATFPVCAGCGRPVMCPNCSVTMTWHQAFGALVCHYCGLATPLNDCPKCGKGEHKLMGLGTEKLEEETRAAFPEARVARLDSDVPGGHRAVEATLARLGRGELDILVGTQMLAKGHDFPGIALVGVILADLGLSLPDFRAAERTFQLLTQVAGRAGRGSTPGRVIVQTMNPEHYSLQTAAAQDFQAFYDQEMGSRRFLFYPPFSRLIQLKFSHPDKAKTEAAARRTAQAARETAKAMAGWGRLNVLGPAPAPLPKIKNRYRFLVLIKTETAKAGQALLDHLLPQVEDRAFLNGVDLRVDVDPVSML